MREHGIEKIIKGYRNECDLEYEKIQARYNLEHGGYETEFWQASEEFVHVSSTLARAALSDKGKLTEILPQKVIAFISNA